MHRPTYAWHHKCFLYNGEREISALLVSQCYELTAAMQLDVHLLLGTLTRDCRLLYLLS